MLEVGTARLKKNCVIKKIIAYKMMIILVLKKKRVKNVHIKFERSEC